MTIYEFGAMIKYRLPVNSQGNFCMRSKYGGFPSGEYTAATATAPMISRQANGYCSRTGCHTSGMPIY